MDYYMDINVCVYTTSIIGCLEFIANKRKCL